MEFSWTDRVSNVELLQRVQDRNILQTIKKQYS